MRKTLLLLFALVHLTSFSQLQEGFEGATWPPAGWAVYNVSGPSISWGLSAQGDNSQPAYEGTHSAFMEREDVATGVAEDWLVTHQFTVPANGVVSFYSRSTIDQDQSTMYELRIHTGANQADLGSYVLIDNFTETELTTTSGQYYQHVVNLPATSFGQQAYLAFVMKGDMGDRWLLDNINITSACSTPTGLEATNITPTSAQLQWDANDATQWEVEFVHANQQFTGEGEIVEQDFYELTDILPGEYKFTVRAICENLQSSWAEAVTFSTIQNTANTITGIVQYDSTGNGGCTGDGMALPYMEIQVTINNDYTYSTYTNAQGEYKLYNLPEGSSSISLQAMPSADAGFDEVVPISQNVVFAEGNTDEVINICLAQPFTVNDISVVMIPTNAARPGFDASYAVTFINEGNSTISEATVNVTFDDSRLNYVSAGMPTSVNGTTLTFTVSNVIPFSQVQNDLIFNVLPPEINHEGDVLNYTVSATMSPQDVNPDDNTGVLNQVLVSSFDANDITVHEGPQIYLDDAGNYLTYTIRFQNTGSANAMTVKIENELEPMLNSATFEPVAGSHDFTVERNNNGLVFTFEDINLTSSTANEDDSRGYVTYRVRPMEEFGLNDVVINTANIYFDEAAAIGTNTVTTVVIDNLGTASNSVSNIALYPNPVSDKLNIAVREGNVLSSSIMDIHGRVIQTVQGLHNAIDTAVLTPGLYLVTISTTEGSSTYKIVKK